jgi:hypothetical protein
MNKYWVCNKYGHIGRFDTVMIIYITLKYWTGWCRPEGFALKYWHEIWDSHGVDCEEHIIYRGSTPHNLIEGYQHLGAVYLLPWSVNSKVMSRRISAAYCLIPLLILRSWRWRGTFLWNFGKLVLHHTRRRQINYWSWQERVSSGNRIAVWSMYMGTAPACLGPFEWSHVRKMWTGRRILLPYNLSFSSSG